MLLISGSNSVQFARKEIIGRSRSTWKSSFNLWTSWKTTTLSQGDQRGMKSLGFWISEIAFHGCSCCCHSVFSHCLVCIMDLCSNSHTYLCSHLDVAAKWELLKEKKIKEGSRVMQVLLSLSMASGFCSACKILPRLPRDLPKEHSQPSVFWWKYLRYRDMEKGRT